ncbi:hypothetical protein D1646_06655 [Pseudoflavonifractor sp. 60]|uniref:putative ABC transporter permease n=1 Tax=Pseudoflavonifractor sp. 60 TaxID=2304576 RepID=UPI00136AD414|nr:putative ABC transporter permease [Pseudoflavonifractor sp. 60]NBI66500.1 hypothetical protein [Pseudoflavonifractor sp. 60]
MLYRFLWIFFIYAFLGWCTEVSYAALVTGKFVNRGFLNGPVCPVYGFGVVIVLGCLTPLSENLPILFVGSVVLTSILEWLTGFVLEKLFHQRWWDYSDEPFNLSGYICLRFSIVWGLACVFVVKLLHPTVLALIHLCPHMLGLVLLAVLSAGMGVDLAATVSTIVKLNRHLEQIDELAAKIKEASNEFGENLAERVLDAAERGADWKEDLDELAFRLAQRRAELADEMEEWEQRRDEQRTQVRRQLEEWHTSVQALLEGESFGRRRLLRAFPRLRSIDHGSALERLRRRGENLRRR